MIRLARYGARKKPFYRIVATDSRNRRDGRYIEILGTYDPQNITVSKESDEKQPKGIVKFKTDRLNHWLKVGAQVSPTVQSLIKRTETAA